MDTPEHDPLIGLQVGNLFTIEAQIGTGACSRVYRALQRDVQTQVAIKILHREYVESEHIRRRFHREARIAARIAHPAVVPVLMSGELPNSGVTRGEAYIVYEFVDGITLRHLLESTKRLNVEATLGILIAASEAVGAAHQLGIVHRDLKPENLMIVQNPGGKRSLRVLDFGLARLHEPGEAPLTHTGAILGTPSYLAPEGARGHGATPSSDVYSLATIGYECLAGRPPFHDASAIKVLTQQVDCEPLTLAEACPSLPIPEPIPGALQQNLAKSPEQRAPDARALARDLRQAASLAGIQPENFGLDSSLWQDPALEMSPDAAPNEHVIRSIAGSHE